MKHSIVPLIATIKRELKIQSLGYKDVAIALGTSENSVKLRFSNQRLSYSHISAIAELLGFSMSELMQKMERPKPWKLTVDIEKKLLSNMRRLLVLLRLMDDWTLDEILDTYDLTRAECLKYLLELQKMEFIELLPNDRIRKLRERNSSWVPNGPFQNYLDKVKAEFLDHTFDDEFAKLYLLNGRLSPAAVTMFQDDLLRLKQRFLDLHDESLLAPAKERRQIILMLAQREWEFPVFAAMRKIKR